jgi:hypothetical protein
MIHRRLRALVPSALWLTAFACSQSEAPTTQKKTDTCRVNETLVDGRCVATAGDAGGDSSLEILRDATSAAKDVSNDVLTPSMIDVSLTGKTLGNPSKMPQLIPPIGDGGAGMNAFDMSIARCTGSPMPTKSWQHNIDLVDYRANAALDFIEMGTGQTLSYKFVTPNAPMLGSFATEENTNFVTASSAQSQTAWSMR